MIAIINLFIYSLILPSGNFHGGGGGEPALSPPPPDNFQMAEFAFSFYDHADVGY